MKKILLIVLLLTSCGKVMALENTNKMYKYYKEKKILMDYKTFNDEDLFDLNDFKKTKLSELTITEPLSKEGRKIYEYDGYHYLKALRVNKIQFVSSNSCTISNIVISNNNETLMNKKEKYNVISDSISFNLNDEYDLENLYFSFKTGDDDEQMFTINFMHDDIILSSVGTIASSNVSLFYAGKNYSINKNTFIDVYSTDKIEGNSLIFKENIKLYNYEDYIYRSYKIEKEYYPDYLTGPIDEYIFKDENDYIEINLEKDKHLENSLDNENINLNPQNNLTINETPNKINNIVENSEYNVIPVIHETNLKNNPSNYQKTVKLNKIHTKNNYFIKYTLLSFLIILLLLFIKIKKNLKKYT